MAMIPLLLKLFETCLVGHGCIQLPRKKVERAREDMSRDEAMDEESGKNDTDRSASCRRYIPYNFIDSKENCASVLAIGISCRLAILVYVVMCFHRRCRFFSLNDHFPMTTPLHFLGSVIL